MSWRQASAKQKSTMIQPPGQLALQRGPSWRWSAPFRFPLSSLWTNRNNIGVRTFKSSQGRGGNWARRQMLRDAHQPVGTRSEMEMRLEDDDDGHDDVTFKSGQRRRSPIQTS